MILVALRSRLRPEREAEYRAMAAEIGPLAVAMPGYLRHKSFTAEDGERVTLVEYESEAAMQAWARDPDHRRAKAAGRRDFFSEYRLQVCSVLRDSGRTAGSVAPARAAADDIPAIHPLCGAELERHIARAHALRDAAIDAAFIAVKHRLIRALHWTADRLRPNWLPASTGAQRHGKCSA